MKMNWNSTLLWYLRYVHCQHVTATGNWREKLLEVIDADQLPVTWGGTQVGPNNDPDCQNKASCSCH